MFFLALTFLLYFAPALLATSRRNPSATAIWLTNFFVGWTIIGWVITLIWALNTPPLSYPAAAYPGVPAGAAGPGAVSGGMGPSYTASDAGAGAVPGWSAVGSAGSVAPAAEAMRTCVACGLEVPADARFCPACGSVESRLG